MSTSFDYGSSDFPSLGGKVKPSGSLAVGAEQERQHSSAATTSMTAAQRLVQPRDHQSEAVSSSVITEDPFPVNTADFEPEPATEPQVETRRKKSIDVSDESAFPTLGGGNQNKSAVTGWGNSNGSSAASRLSKLAAAENSAAGKSRSTGENGATASRAAGILSETIRLQSSQIHIQAPAANSGFAIGRGKGTFSNERESEPKTLGEVLKLLMKRHPTVTVEASKSKEVTTFLIKAKNEGNAQREIDQVKKELLARLAKKVSTEIKVPGNLRGFIVGAKGRTLNGIIDSTGAQIQLPDRDAVVETDESAEQGPDGPLISIALSGDETAVESAKAQILAIVGERMSKTETKLDNVPKEFWSLLNGSKGSRIAEIVDSVQATGQVNVFIPRLYEKRGGVSAAGETEEKEETAEKLISLSGEREAVARVEQAIQAEVAELKRTTTTASIGVNKRQHRFLVGSAADEILEGSGCSIELPKQEDLDDKVTIRGTQQNILKAFSLVMEKANSQPIDSLDLTTAHAGKHDRKLYAQQLTRYLLRTSKLKPLTEQHNVQIYLPRPAAIEAGTPLIEIVAKDQNGLQSARSGIIEIVRAFPPPRFGVVQIDRLLHRHLIGKNGKNAKNLQEKFKTEILFSRENDEDDEILLVYSGDGNPAEAIQNVQNEIQELAKSAADISSTTLTIPQVLHRSIIGQAGTTLNAIIGEEKLVSVQFGPKNRAEPSKKGEEDLVLIRGPSEAVSRVEKQIKEIAERARNEEIENSFLAEFEMETSAVRHIVGKAGSGINKLRDELGVRVDFEELNSAAKKGKSAAGSAGKSTVRIKGRQENVQEAQNRIQALVTKMADEVNLSLNIPAALDRGALIGKQGTYLKRLEEKYFVRINFPRAKGANPSEEEGSRDNSNPNEITIRGGKKGAEQAKAELVALIAYEQENGNSLNFTVSSKSLARILGKSGQQINQIKDETKVQSVDVDQSKDAPTATITVRGTKSAVKAAQAQILAISQEVDDEARLTLQVPREYHQILIGTGGSSIRELIANAGGPTDARASGNLVRFPRSEEAGKDDVIITAHKALADKIKKALEEKVAELKSRIVWGIAVAQTNHAAIIGKGASALQSLQRTHGVKVVMPGWNEYDQVGPVSNPEDVQGAKSNEIIKIVGAKESAVAAATELSKTHTTGPSASSTISVPRGLHAQIAQGGKFFRSLPRGTRVSHGNQKPPASSVKARKPATPASQGTAAARIDDDGAAESGIEFEMVSLESETSESAETGEIDWIVESPTQQAADDVINQIKQLIQSANERTHIAYLTVPRGLMPRIVGRGGAGLEQLRSHGVEVEVVGKRDSNQLTLIGSPAAIEEAHQAILQLANRPSRQQREREDY